MITVMLDSVRLVSLDIWRVERCLSGWSSWLGRPTSSSTAGHAVLFSTRVLRSAALMPLVGASCSPSLFSKVSSLSLF